MADLSHRVLLDMFEQIPIPLMVRSIETEQFVAVNAALENLTGFARDELVGKTPSQTQLFDLIVHHDENVLQVVREGYIAERSVELRGKQGNAIPVTFWSARIRAGDGIVILSLIRPR